jgi:two-component system chemotaxis sensor kinase CheA
MSEQDAIYAVFAQEAREQLGELEAGLLRMENGASDEETINAIFRAAHTIKGGSGVVELSHIEAFTHVLENLLDRLRNGEIQVSGDMVTDLLKGCDHLGALLKQVDAGRRDSDPALAAEGELVKQILQRHDAAAPLAVEDEDEDEGEVALAPVPQSGGVGHDCWHISIRFGSNVLRSGMDPMAFLRYLFSLGEIVQVVTLLDAMPAAAEMDPESCYLGFELSLRSQVDKAAIERVFDFVRDECELHILPPHSLVADYIALIEDLPEETLQLGEILVRSGALTREELSAGLARQQATQAAPPLGEILVAQHALQSEIVQAAAAKQGAVADKKATESRLIRVQADKLDELIDLVGEMVIAGAAANLAAQITGQTQLLETTSVLSRLVERIRDSAL